MTPPSRPLNDFMVEQLKDLEFRKIFLSEALQSGEQRVFLKALRLAVQASGKSGDQLAKAAGIGRTHLYRALSETGNPSWGAIVALLKELGLDISIKKRRRSKSA